MEFKTAAEVELEIKRLTSIKEEMKNQESQLTPQKRLAIILHEKHCKCNHNDGCSWFYFIKNGYPTWDDPIQQSYLYKCNIIWTNFKALLPNKSKEDLELIITHMFKLIFDRY